MLDSSFVESAWETDVMLSFACKILVRMMLGTSCYRQLFSVDLTTVTFGLQSQLRLLFKKNISLGYNFETIDEHIKNVKK